MEIVNAIIESASLDGDDHGLLTSYLQLDYGGSGQGFGGYALYLPKDFLHGKIDSGYAGHWIWRCMQIAGVTSWDKMKGRTIRVQLTEKGFGGAKIHGIGHIIKDDWFIPSIDFKKSD